MSDSANLAPGVRTRRLRAFVILIALCVAVGLALAGYAGRPGPPAAQWPAGLDVRWAFYTPDLPALLEDNGSSPLEPLLSLGLAACLDESAHARLRQRGGDGSLLNLRREISGPLLFLQMRAGWAAIVQPALRSVAYARALSVEETRAAVSAAVPPSAGVWYCQTPYGVAMSTEPGVLLQIAEARPMPAETPLNDAAFQFRWAGAEGDALAAPSATILLQNTERLPCQAVCPWQGAPLPPGVMPRWLPQDCTLTVQTAHPQHLLEIAQQCVRARDHILPANAILDLLPWTRIRRVLQYPDWSHTEVSTTAVAWIGLDRTDVLPWPLIAGRIKAPALGSNPWEFMLRDRPRIPYQWDKVPGELAPLWGDPLTAAFAGREGTWFAATRETAMQWILSSPGGLAGYGTGSMIAQGHWPALVSALVQAGRFAAQESLLPSTGEAEFEQTWLPRLTALAGLGRWEIAAVAEGDVLRIDGLLAAGRTP